MLEAPCLRSSISLEVRLFLPRNRAGAALLPKGLYESIRSMPGIGWGAFSRSFIKMGQGEDADERHVHAKVYRFFSRRPKREILFVGSANLTQAAHQRGGNMETGFLIEVETPRRPEFWLAPEERRQTSFAEPGDGEAIAASGGTRLMVRFWWDDQLAEVYWDATHWSPTLRVEAKGEFVFEVSGIEPRCWSPLPGQVAARMGAILRRTSMFTVLGEGPEPGALLVQEEAMTHKPSLLTDLSAADILRYWSLLTVEQRAAFIEAKGADLVKLGAGLDLVTDLGILASEDTLFDRFAGFFHAFGCLERSVIKALEDGNEVEACYRLFGRKYDSLGTLLVRLIGEEDAVDQVDRYLLALCAKQLCAQIAQAYPEFWTEYSDYAEELTRLVGDACKVREALCAQEPADLPAFLAWFDDWFLKRAAPVETTV